MSHARIAEELSSFGGFSTWEEHAIGFFVGLQSAHDIGRSPNLVHSLLYGKTAVRKRDGRLKEILPGQLAVSLMHRVPAADGARDRNAMDAIAGHPFDAFAGEELGR